MEHLLALISINDMLYSLARQGLCEIMNCIYNCRFIIFISPILPWPVAEISIEIESKAVGGQERTDIDHHAWS